MEDNIFIEVLLYSNTMEANKNMKHSKVTQVSDIPQVRDSLIELQQDIVRIQNETGNPEIQPSDKVEIEWQELDYWRIELRRLLSFFN